MEVETEGWERRNEEQLINLSSLMGGGDCSQKPAQALIANHEVIEVFDFVRESAHVQEVDDCKRPLRHGTRF